ncbi:MAG: hypothetical protein ACM3SR_04220 [Ignavibacteriales bacterium]
MNVTLDNLKTTFDAMMDTLPKDYAGKWVAIYEGGVVDSDTPDSVLISRFYRKYGNVPVYIDNVGEKRVPKV